MKCGTPDRLMYAPAVELGYIDEMTELDNAELANMYMSLRSMELALIGAGVGGDIKHTSELKFSTITGNAKPRCRGIA